jgi:TonB family protein
LALGRETRVKRSSWLGGAVLLAAYCAATIAGDDDSAWAIPKLPQTKGSLNNNYYPDAARRAGTEGRVLIAFDISADGRVRNPSVIWSENGAFDASALGMLKEMRFSVPADWMNTGAHRRWRLGFVFRLAPSGGQDCDFAIPTETLFVTGSRLRGGPVRAIPEIGTSRGCPKLPLPP